MPHNPLDPVVRHVRRLADGRNAAELTDGQLLDRFAAGRDAAALEALVGRHGPLVHGVCRRVLGPRPEADDAFQATFLVLLRKAGALDRRGSVAPWLHAVAHRTALRARAAGRLSFSASPPEPATTADPLDELTGRELCAALDEELRRLPERLRAPLVLCCLEGRTRDEAAELLGWSVGSVKGRLERGRELLRSRLARRGLALSATVFAAALAGSPASAVPPALAVKTIRVVTDLLLYPATDGPARVASLADGVLRAMLLSKLNVVVVALALCVALSAAGLAARHALAAPADPAPPAAPPGDGPRPAGPRLDALGDPLPPGAVARLGTERFRHTNTVRSVAYSADGSRLVTASWDRTVRLWDAKNGRELRRFAVPGGGSGAAVSPDGRLVVSGDMDATLIFWDARTGRELRRSAKLENTIFFIAFSPDGKLVAAASGDALRLWDAATGKELHNLTLPKGGARPLGFSPDGKALAAGCADGTVRLWDAATGKESLCLTGHEGRVWSFAFAADGKTITTVGGDRTVRLWDAATGRERKRWPRSPAAFEVKPAEGRPGPNATACDGRTLAAGGNDGRVVLWDVAAGKERGTLRVPGQDDERRGPWVMGLALSPDGKTLAVSTTGKAVTFWDTATLTERLTYPGHRDAVNAVAFLAGGGLASAGEDGALCFWEAAGGKERHREQAHREAVKALVASPDGRTLVTAGGDGKVRVWDAATRKEVRQWAAHQGGVEDAALSPDGKTLATGAWQDHAIRLWGLDGKEKLTIKLDNGGNYGNLPLCFSPDGKLLASGSGDRTKDGLSLWDAATGKELRRIPEQVGGRGSLAFSRDGKALAVAGGKTIRLYDPATGLRTGGFDGDDDAGSCVAYSPDGRLLAAGGGPARPTVRVWEVASGRLVGKREGHKGWLRCVGFSPDGRTIATGSEDTTAVLWDVTAFGGDGKAPDGLDALWADLGGDDAGRARRAVWALEADPVRSVPFLAGRLSPVAAADEGRVARLVRDLDAENFDERERATRELERLGEAAGPGLRKALAGRPSAEVRRRAEGLLEKLGAAPGPELLRGVRAVEVLEKAGTAEARRALAGLAKGVAEARLTREAEAALARITGAGASKSP